jgi:hypothetical protein
MTPEMTIATRSSVKFRFKMFLLSMSPDARFPYAAAQKMSTILDPNICPRIARILLANDARPGHRQG